MPDGVKTWLGPCPGTSNTVEILKHPLWDNFAVSTIRKSDPCRPQLPRLYFLVNATLLAQAQPWSLQHLPGLYGSISDQDFQTFLLQSRGCCCPVLSKDQSIASYFSLIPVPDFSFPLTRTEATTSRRPANEVCSSSILLAFLCDQKIPTTK